MRVTLGGGITRKVFAAAHDPLLAHRVVECSRIANDLFDRLSVATTTQRVVRIVVEGNIENRTKIEIETKSAQQAPRDLAVPADKIDIVLVAQLLGVWRLVADQTQPRDAPTFLVDGDDRLDLAQLAQIIDQSAQLHRALDVAPEKNEAARLYALKQLCRLRIEHFAGHAGEDQLTERIVPHILHAKLDGAQGK